MVSEVVKQNGLILETVTYFHATTISKRRRNRVDCLRDNKGNWCHDAETLKNMARDFLREEFPISGAFSMLSSRAYNSLCMPVSDIEIKDALLIIWVQGCLHAVFVWWSWAYFLVKS